MAVPQKISSIINSFKSCYDAGMGCSNGGGCGATNSNKCYQCSNDPNNCVCEPSTPSKQKCKSPGKWVLQTPPPKAPPTDMEMITDMQMMAAATTSNLYKICYTNCTKDQERFFNRGGYDLQVFDKCLKGCKKEEASRQGSGLPPI